MGFDEMAVWVCIAGYASSVFILGLREMRAVSIVPCCTVSRGREGVGTVQGGKGVGVSRDITPIDNRGGKGGGLF